MTVGEALEVFRARWAGPGPDRRDVEERAALRLRDSSREFLVMDTGTERDRLFVRIGEDDRVKWGERGKAPKLTRGWHSGYVHRLEDVDRIFDGAAARVEAARRAT